MRIRNGRGKKGTDEMLTIGVTGHRDPWAEDVPLLAARVGEVLAALKRQCGEVRMLNSLAEGGDQICARAALELGIPIACALPFEEREYRTDFAGEALGAYLDLLGRCERVFVAPAVEPVSAPPSRDDGYRQAGLYIARESDVLLALWDGGVGRPGGCGSREVAEYFLAHRATGGRFVAQVVTRRRSGEALLRPCAVACLTSDWEGAVRNLHGR